MTDDLDLLRGSATPKPDPDARARAIDAGLAEFNRVQTQGSAKTERPTGIATLWSGLMNYLSSVSRPAMTVAFVACLAVPTAVFVLNEGPQGTQKFGDLTGAVSAPEVSEVETDLGATLAQGEQVAEDAAPRTLTRERPALRPVPPAPAETANSAPVDPGLFRGGVASQAPVIEGPAQLSREVEAVEDRLMSRSSGVQRIQLDAIRAEPVEQEQFAGEVPGGVKQVSEEPISTFSADVDTASYARLRRAILEGQIPNPAMVRTEEVVNAFDYDYPAPNGRDVPFRATTTLTDSPWTEGARVLHIGIKGYDFAPGERPAANLVFLVDTSGSMQAADKLPLLVQSLKMLLGQLTDNDTVSIVAYAGSAGVVLKPTPATNRRAIEVALDRLSAGGGTAGAEGIQAAYALAEDAFIDGGANRVILATDGDFNVGAAGPEALEDLIEEKRDTGIGLTVLGFGTGNLRDDAMQALAQAGNGTAAYIDTLREARHVLGREAQGALYTIAGDVKLQVEFNPAAVQSYRLVGYETRALRTQDFDNDRVDAGEIGAGHEVTAIYELFNQPDRPLRYGVVTDEAPTEAGTRTDELAFVQIRYKRPGEDNSQLIANPVPVADYAPLNQVSEDVRFSLAAAGFAEKLRNVNGLEDTDWAEIEALARSAVGSDSDGRRRELVDLIGITGALNR